MTPKSSTDILSNYTITDEEWKRDMRDLIHRTPEKKKILEEVKSGIKNS